MAKKCNNPKTMPYKEITIQVHPDFLPRIRAHRTGNWSRGISSNLSKYAYFVFLFEVNEYIPKAHKLTDYQIARCVANEFPKWDRGQRILATASGNFTGDTYDTIAYYRRRYNAGTLLYNNPGRKGPISFRYNHEGIRVTSQFCKGVEPKPLPAKELDRILRKYGPEVRSGNGDFDFEVKEVKKHDRVRKPLGRPSYDSFDWCI